MNRIVQWLEGVFGTYPFLVIFTNLFACAFAVLIGWLCFLVNEEPLQQVFNVLIALLGALLGWALGMFFVPYTAKDAARFSAIGQAISAFVSGYAVSKIDRFFEATMFFDNDLPITMTWVRIGLFTCSILLVMLTVFSNRAYFRTEPSSKKTINYESQKGPSGR